MESLPSTEECLVHLYHHTQWSCYVLNIIERFIFQTVAEAVASSGATSEVAPPAPDPSSPSSPLLTQPPVEQVSEVSPVAGDVLQGVEISQSELSLSELGLGGYTPVGVIQNILECMHVDMGMPWWAAIVAGEELQLHVTIWGILVSS